MSDPFGLDPCKKDNTPAECRDGVKLPTTTVRGYRRRLRVPLEFSRLQQLSSEDVVLFAEEIESERLLQQQFAARYNRTSEYCFATAGGRNFTGCAWNVSPVQECVEAEALKVGVTAAAATVAVGKKFGPAAGKAAGVGAVVTGGVRAIVDETCSPQRL
jgi:hypothetical protein